MNIKSILTLTLTLTLTRTTVSGTDYPCPYEECLCRNNWTVECRDLKLSSLPPLKSGTFPQTNMEISDTDITSISDGQLPAGMVDLNIARSPALAHISHDAFTTSADTLLYLRIQNTRITRIPDLADMEILPNLYLPYNKITDDPDVSLPDSLEVLNLNDNSLNHIPARVSTLSNLEWLFLGGNNIRNIDTFIFPSSLTSLNLGDNNIEEIHSILFAQNTSSLEILYLSYSPLKHISDTAFSQLTKLEHLSLLSTKLTRLPLALMTLTHLTSELDLGGNGDTMACTCEEAGLATWYRGLASLLIRGNCKNGTSVESFLTQVAPNCPKL